MAITYKKDYVYSDAPKVGEHPVFFIGTKNFIFVFPLSSSKSINLGSKIQTSTYTIGGLRPDLYFKQLLDNPETTLESLELEFYTRVDEYDSSEVIKCELKKISDEKFFKVSSNFFGSSLMIGQQKIGFNKLLITPLGKAYKNDIKEFYS